MGRLVPMLCVLSVLLGLSGTAAAAEENGSRSLALNVTDEGEWRFSGGNQQGTFYSPLTQINSRDVGRLGFAWQFAIGDRRGMEGTPLFVNGVLLVPAPWGKVFALDGRSGREIWRFDPHSDGQYARWAASDVVSRGIAYARGRVYTVATDCRLFALDASNGHVIWVTQTLAKLQPGYACESAPTLAGGVVAVGNAGADNGSGGVRGYVSAFSQTDGKFAWRFYTVPSLKDDRPDPVMRRAEATWDPKRSVDSGGGGTVWDQIAYDPQLDLLYFGTANAAPYDAPRDWRGGRKTDRLYTASIIALHARTGRMAWYYQTTPGDLWDFDATQPLVLARLRVHGVDRRVLMQANKNGYFYILDRVTGKPLRAMPFAYMNWSTGMDAGFRPMVSREVDYSSSPKWVYPSDMGAHSWPPMSLSAETGLVYIPTIEAPDLMADVRKNPGSRLSSLDGSLGVTQILPDKALSLKFWEPMVGRLPGLSSSLPSGMKPGISEELEALDPRTGRVVWRQQTSAGYMVMNGGVLSTAGGLELAGREDGEFVAYDASTGKILKEFQTGSAIMAAPMSYSVGGKQYVAVLCGHGGGILDYLGTAAMKYRNEDRVLTFALDGAPSVPKPPVRATASLPKPPARQDSPELLARGRDLFTEHCGRCHALDVPGVAPDLTQIPVIYSQSAFDAVVLGGALVQAGMARFDDIIDERDTRALRAYLVDQAWDAYEAEARKRSLSAH